MELKPEIISEVCKEIQKHHDIFKIRFMLDKRSKKRQLYIDGITQEVQLENCHVYSVKKAEVEHKIKEVSSSLQLSVNIENGPVFLVALFNIDDGSQRILFIIHHLYVDTVSWNILMNDFQKGYQQIMQGIVLDLGHRTMSYKSWSQFLSQYANSEEIKKDIPFWQSQMDSVKKRRDK